MKRRLEPNAGGARRVGPWVVADALMFTTMNLLVAFQVNHAPLAVVLFLRFVFGIPVVCVAAHISGDGRDLLHALNLKRGGHTMFMGAAASGAACAFWYSGLQTVPVALATAISFSKGFILTVLASLFLRERPPLARWLACLVGMIGVCLVVHPETAAFDRGTTFVLLSALFSAISILQTRSAACRMQPWLVAFGRCVWGAVFTSVVAIPQWIWPTPQVLVTTFAVGTLAIGVQFAATQIYAHGDVQSVAPFDLLRLVLATAVEMVFIGLVLDASTVAGLVLILLVLAAQSALLKPLLLHIWKSWEVRHDYR